MSHPPHWDYVPFIPQFPSIPSPKILKETAKAHTRLQEYQSMLDWLEQYPQKYPDARIVHIGPRIAILGPASSKPERVYVSYHKPYSWYAESVREFVSGHEGVFDQHLLVQGKPMQEIQTFHDYVFRQGWYWRMSIMCLSEMDWKKSMLRRKNKPVLEWVDNLAFCESPYPSRTRSSDHRRP